MVFANLDQMKIYHEAFYDGFSAATIGKEEEMRNLKKQTLEKCLEMYKANTPTVFKDWVLKELGGLND